MSKVFQFSIAIFFIIILVTGLVIIVQNAFKIRSTMNLLKKKILLNRKAIKSLTMKSDNLPEASESKHLTSFVNKFKKQSLNQDANS